jgi:hypothetical protein
MTPFLPGIPINCEAGGEKPQVRFWGILLQTETNFVDKITQEPQI